MQGNNLITVDCFNCKVETAGAFGMRGCLIKKFFSLLRINVIGLFLGQFEATIAYFCSELLHLFVLLMWLKFYHSSISPFKLEVLQYRGFDKSFFSTQPGP